MPNPAGVTAPILIGVLYDFPQADGGALFEEAVRLGLAEVEVGGRLDRPVELVSRQAHGLPAGTAHDVARSFAELADLGVLAILGPSISDNGLVVAELADRAGVPCINYTGGERTRNAWMFHYQVGSLEEEPSVLIGHLVRQGQRSVAVAHDHSPVGRRYAEFLAEACASAGVDIVASAAVSPLAEDLTPAVRRLRASDPAALVYLGLGVAARALSMAVAEVKWRVPVVSNSALMFGYARKDWRAGWEDWVYVDSVADDNSTRARLR
ncbi:MAG TPA: ABC transporter substrate-binding protein, partial [Acidimicrobiales bacterium]|nr:ABC transporter substrate-binding protein [Acidimicrobiales bacterium]